MYNIEAIINAVLLPYLSDKIPKNDAPTNLPIDKPTCTIVLQTFESHTKSH